ncbi:MAG: cyclopropane-fatty-acyl-phospholipid synthase family protein [Proteobacteria bacterium]|nr:cyclopropane-fatty-acyl-phospholipid synthase family protein [Pseudomonadota bacterium]
MKNGTLTIIDHDGRPHVCGNGSPPHVTVRFKDPNLGTKLFQNPALYAGEAYMDGTLVVENADIYTMLALVMSNLAGYHGHWLARSMKSVERSMSLVRTYNPIARSKQNVAHHYDLSTTLYRTFLDDHMQYSMAYFRMPQDSLEQAQIQKMTHIGTKLLLQPGQTVLDIGCGWGGLALFLHRTYGVKVVGISLSERQIEVANQRAVAANVGDNVTFRLQDYRHVTETFDRVVSVGMFEHVGLPHYRRFFEVVRDRLSPDGVALLHTIGRTDGPGATDSWTNKYIFPGGYSPALSEVVPHIERAGLIMTDIEILRLHYAHTLRAWRERFMARREDIKKLYDERFCRMWEFFLSTAEGAFHYGFHVNFHIQMSKKLETVPLTRDYMYQSA